MDLRALAALWILGVASSGALAAPALGNLTAVSVGGGHACAITSAGGLKCWGANHWGQLGDGLQISRSVPGDVAGLTSGVVAVSAGHVQTCAVTSGGAVKCWGNNRDQRLRVGSSADFVLAPAQVVGLESGMAAVATGELHACALTTSGGVKCWGLNLSGNLGDGTTIDRTAPVDVAGLASGVVAIGSQCALTSAGGVKCWGGTAGATPVDIVGAAAGMAQLAPNGKCGVTSSGGVKCWGTGTVAEDVTGATSGVATVGAGIGHACALSTAGGVQCWGTSNVWGQLGDGTTSNDSTPRPPADVSGLTSGIAAVAVGEISSCALTQGGTAMCWGANHSGQMGNNTSEPAQPTPVAVLDYLLQDILFPGLASRDLASLAFDPPASATSGLPVALVSSTPAVCTVSGPTVSLHAIGICSLTAQQAGDGTYYRANPIVHRFLVTGGSGPRLVNLSTRLRVGTGDNVGIAGFIVQSAQPKTVLVRARAASLGSSGVAGTLPNPYVSLHGSGPDTANEDWQQHADAALMQEIGLAPSDPTESALLVTLQPHVAYSAIVSDRSGGSGVAILELFEIDRAETPLINISTRGQVLTGEDVLIAGFIVQGNGPQTVVVRARGPSMAQFGVSNLIANPQLQLFSGQTQIAFNDDWQQASNAGTIQAAGFAPSDPNESAIHVTLAPGAYTAVVTGVGGTTGVGIVEVFAVP